tara:strand:+ start:935 stop:1177 length:243 start_codon:yes stop_codon:yes gene_type:complete
MTMTSWTLDRINLERQRAEIAESVTLPVKDFIALLDQAKDSHDQFAQYERGVSAGFDEAIYEVKRGEIDPATYQRNPNKG